MLDPSIEVMPSAEPAYCPSCELRHTRRPDWLCPRCGMPVDAEVPRPTARPATRGEEGFPAGSRIASAIMVLAGGALAAGVARSPSAEHRWPLVAAAVVLVVLGLGSSLTISWARWTAVGAGVVAAVLVAEDLIRDRLPDLMPDPLPPVVRAWLRDLLRPLYPATLFFVLAFLAGGLLLLVGRPRRARLAIGVLLAAPLVVLQVIRVIGGR